MSVDHPKRGTLGKIPTIELTRGVGNRTANRTLNEFRADIGRCLPIPPTPMIQGHRLAARQVPSANLLPPRQIPLEHPPRPDGWEISGPKRP